MSSRKGGRLRRPDALDEAPSLVAYDNQDGVAHIRLNRPEKLNALNDQLVTDLGRAFERFDQDDDAFVALLHGAGRAFSSGADLVEAQRRQDNVSGVWSAGRRPRELFHRFIHWKPIIAAVHGYALGAGLGLALRSDAIIATRSAKLQITETVRGLPAGGLWALMNFRGGGALADDAALTGRFFTGEEAALRGVVTQATGDGDYLAVGESYARRIAKLPISSVRSAVRVRRWYMQDAERQAGFLAEPRPLLDMDRVRPGTSPFLSRLDDPVSQP